MRHQISTSVSIAALFAAQMLQAADHRAAARAIETRLTSQYRLSDPTPGRGFGTMVIITQPGLEASPVGVNPTAGATWERGFLKLTFSTTSMARNLRIPVMPGQRAFITKIEAKETHVVFDLLLPEPINGIHFRTTVHFDFGKGYLESPDFGLINRTIPEVLQVDQPPPRGGGGYQPSQQAPPPPPQRQYAEPPPPPPPPPTYTPQQPADAGARPTIEIKPGMTSDQVKSAMGNPDRTVKLGPKEIYFFGKLKVTLINGKVTDVE